MEVKKQVEKTTYVAQDGKEFDKENDCVKYDAGLEYNRLKKENGPAISEVTSHKIKGLIKMFLIERDKNNSINSGLRGFPEDLYDCSEIYMARVCREGDIEQISAFCRSKEDEDRYEASPFRFLMDKGYLIIVGTLFTRMFNNSHVTIIPYQEFIDFCDEVVMDIKSIDMFFNY